MICILIGWQAYRGKPYTLENMLYIITNSNPRKEEKIKKLLARPIEHLKPS